MTHTFPRLRVFAVAWLLPPTSLLVTYLALAGVAYGITHRILKRVLPSARSR